LLLAALMLGCRLIHNGRFTTPDVILDLSCDFAVTVCAAVPAIWQVAHMLTPALPCHRIISIDFEPTKNRLREPL
jgi:hypothetical protein